ncbi:hypothetical protein DOM22_02200 [Bdellovibrio sp. ZAP7]|uniref:hypothetical protein n=1 Tax=Bdellovibrio sp. ZAP7 TaxID=2231053 RepID=UPI001157327D|nr:hypothetical protein [Bdellovibrio sp. ZAP7]QDK44054.1 hypothetical protein DOM22_02200 [Bdellovibrio sp. ZAP7]
MKLFIGLMTLLIACVSFAKPTKPVYRRALIKVSVFRTELKKVGDMYEYTAEKVCDNQQQIDVWDWRQPTEPTNWENFSISCDSTYNGKKVTALITATAFVNRDYTDEENYDVLTFSTGFLLTDKKTQKITTHFSTMIQSKDLNSNSLMTTLGPKEESICDSSGCTTPPPEKINASVEFIGL